MKKRLCILVSVVVFVGTVLFGGCSKETLPITSVEQQGGYAPVKHIGQVPDELKDVVDNNRFCDVIAFEDCLLKAETIDINEADRTAAYRIRFTRLSRRLGVCRERSA